MRNFTLVFAVGLTLAGCSGADDDRPAAQSTAEVTQAAAEPRPESRPLACNLVTAAEMTAIVGFEVVAEPDDSSNGTTACTYKKPTGLSPDVELAFTWGDGAAAMQGMGLATKHEPGLTSPYDGVGDEAVAVGPVLFVRSGEDLIKMQFSGVDDPPGAAKRIFDTAKARM
jgi:hypothetical protein